MVVKLCLVCASVQSTISSALIRQVTKDRTIYDRKPRFLGVRREFNSENKRIVTRREDTWETTILGWTQPLVGQFTLPQWLSLAGIRGTIHG